MRCLEAVRARDLSFLNYANFSHRFHDWQLFAVHLDDLMYFVLLRHGICVENASRYRDISVRVYAFLKGNDFPIEEQVLVGLPVDNEVDYANKFLVFLSHGK